MDFKFNYNPILKIDEVCKEGTGKVIVLQLIGIVVMKQNRPPEPACRFYLSRIHFSIFLKFVCCIMNNWDVYGFSNQLHPSTKSQYVLQELKSSVHSATVML